MISFTRVFASQLKSRLRDRRLTLGPLMTCDSWPGYLEILKSEGMDFVVADFEHSSHSLERAEELCRTARLLDLPLLIRPEACVYHLLRKYMDMGPCGIMLPWTESREQLDILRDALFLPPKGRRGPGGPSILANRSLDRAGWDEVESSLFTLIQIESPTGMRSLRHLAACDWVDAVMVGPYDLSVNLDRCGQLDHPEVVAAIQRIYDESTDAGKPCGMVVLTPEQGRFWMDRGFRFLITAEVSAMVRMQARHLVQSLRRA
jgi:2-keto-3-deoxy-L-rhamnonate aldolase RhmA